MLSRWLGFVAVATAVGSCSFEPDYRDTSYVCRLDRCPSGYICIDEICVVGPSDASIAEPDSGAQASCDELFGRIDEYELCHETEDTCTIGGNVNASCDEVCEAADMACEEAHDSDQGAVCTASGESTCDVDHSRAKCTCVRDAAPVPDAGEDKPTCEEQFGGASGFMLCSETATTCTFNAQAADTSCDDHCGLFDSTCVVAADSNAGEECVEVVSTNCGSPHSSVICTCER